MRIARHTSAVPLVALDSNFVDLARDALTSDDHVDAMEAMDSPPPFGCDSCLEAEVFAASRSLGQRSCNLRRHSP